MPYLIAGARTNIRNKENQLPYDLSAKNPEVGRQLMVRGKRSLFTSPLVISPLPLSLLLL